VFAKMQVENYYFKSETIPTIPFFKRYINVMVLFFPVTTFLLIPAVQGTTIITVLSALLFMILLAVPAGTNKGLFVKELLYFFVIFLTFSIISQYLNLVFGLKLIKGLVLVNKGDYMDSFFRISHFTQGMYLLIPFLIYLFIKYYADYTVMDYVFWGVRLLCFYGLYEVIFFVLTGQPGDFIMNRKFGEMDASMSQSASVAGLSVLRMKGYTGEPSMFSFTVFPFWVLTYAFKRKFDNLLFLLCLLLTFSTTAYFAMLLFHAAWFLYKKRYQQIIYVLGILVIVLAILQLDSFRDKADSIYNFVFGEKLGGNNDSSDSRGGNIITHVTYWSKLHPLSQLFGIGFGYIRSTDFFSTLLVNNGVLGIIVFSTFVFKNLGISLPKGDLAFCYYSGLVITYFIMMATVPEFAYPSLWIYLALGYIFHRSFNTSPDVE